jgi:hypothetical protein
MEYNKELILTRITLFKKDMIIKDKFDAYIDSSNKIFDRIDGLNLTPLGDNYYNTNDIVWGIKFKTDVNNNFRLYENESSVEFLIESFSPKWGYDCGLSNLIKDIKDDFGNDDHLDKFGREARQYILEFESWSYFDSYAGDGDAGIEYVKIFEI